MKFSYFLIKKLVGYDILKSEKELKASLSTAKRRISSLSEQKSELASSLQDKDYQINTLSKAVETSNNDLASKQLEIQELTNTICIKDQTIQDLLAKNKSNDEIIVELSGRIESKESELGELESKIENLKTSNRSKQGTIMNHVMKINALTEEIDSMRNDSEKNKLEIDKLKKENIELEKVNKEKENLVLQLNEITDEKETLASSKLELEKKVESLEQELNNASTAKSDEVRQLENQIQENEETIQSKKREIDVLKIEMQEGESRFKEVCDQLSIIRTERDELSEKVNNLELQNQNLGKEKNKLAERLEELQQELSQIKEVSAEVEDNVPHSIESPNSEQHIETEKEVLDVVPIFDEEPKESHEEDISEPVIPEPIAEEKPKLTEPKREDSKPEKENVIRPAVKKHDKSKETEAIELSDGSIKDMPLITNDSNRQTQRTIEYVYDENGRIVYADEFFNRSAEEIAQVGRKMSEAEISGNRYWTCGLCHHRVKIAHRTFNGNESLFFVHAKRDHYCPWIKKATSSKDDIDEEALLDSDDIFVEETIEERKTESRELKEKIFALLTSPESEDMGISDVQMDEIIRSNVPYMKWRRPDISFLHNDRKIVIELQKKSHDLDSIVDRDVFFRLNDIQILWIFGSESDTSYDYMRKLNYKNTMFDNHRNVFVFDKEAQAKSEEEGILYLKCNWLNADDSWHFRIENSGANGKLISIEHLIYDDNYCKPYYFDANEEYFAIYPEAREAYMAAKMSREELKKAIEEKWTRDKDYEEAIANMRQRQSKATPYCVSGLWGFRFNTTVIIPPIFTKEPKDLFNGFYVVNQGSYYGIVNYFGEKIVNWNGYIPCDDMDYDATNKRVLFSNNGKWGVADLKGEELISPDYESVQNWTQNAYRVKSEEKWGICNIENHIIARCKYNKIEEFVNSRAFATKPNHSKSWMTVSGYIDENGKEIITDKIRLEEGRFIAQAFEMWGLITNNEEIILPFIYEEILPWFGDMIRVKEYGKWSIYNILDKTTLNARSYDYVGEYKDGVAKVVSSNVETLIDQFGNEVAQDIIELKDGFKKTKIAGKWGVIDANGEIIVNHQYDEIGSFRSRLIGFINNGVIKLNGSYQFPIPMSGKFLTADEKHRLHFNIGGVECLMHDSLLKQTKMLYSDVCVKGKTCSCLSFMELIMSKERYWLRMIDPSKSPKKLSHGDKNEDFRLQETLTGNVCSFVCKKSIKRKVMVEFGDGRKTTVPRRYFSPKEKIDTLEIGDSIILQKTGYDDDLDQTIWIVIDE